MVVHGLHGGVTHLLALSAARRCLLLSRLTIVFPEARIHIGLNRGDVLENVVNDSLLDGPPEEVQLTHGGLLNRRLTAHLETDPLATAKRIEESLAIGLELTLIVEMNEKLTAIEGVGHVKLLGVVRDEPIDQTEGGR